MANRAEYWRQMVTEWESSGLSQAEFCRRRGLKAVTFGWWKQRLVGSTARSDGRNRRNRVAQKIDAASSHSGVNDQAPSSVAVGEPCTDYRTPSSVAVGKPSAGDRTPPFVAVDKPGADHRAPSFVEVALSGEMAAGRSPMVSGLGGAQKSRYEVTFPCGTSIRLPADFDADKVSQLISAVTRPC